MRRSARLWVCYDCGIGSILLYALSVSMQILYKIPINHYLSALK